MEMQSTKYSSAKLIFVAHGDISRRDIVEAEVDFVERNRVLVEFSAVDVTTEDDIAKNKSTFRFALASPESLDDKFDDLFLFFGVDPLEVWRRYVKALGAYNQQLSRELARKKRLARISQRV